MTGRTYTPEELQDLTDRIFELRKRIEQGKMLFAEHLADDFNASLKAIRLSSSGLVDPETVDGRIRAATLAIRAFTYREEVKKEGTVSQVQEAYFNILFGTFGQMYANLLKHGANPGEAGRAFAENETLVREISGMLPEFITQIAEFWNSARDVGLYHLQDGRQLKAAFAGDLFPAYWKNVVSTAGLYIDTTVLPCPILRIAPLVGIFPAKKIVQILLKHVFTAMSYREIATADVDPPIVLFLPNEDDVQEDSRRNVVERATPVTLKHASCLFGRLFDSVEHLHDFCQALNSVEKLIAEVKRPDRLLFDSEWKLDPKLQLERAMTDSDYRLRADNPDNAGIFLFEGILGRMPQAVAALENANELFATPLLGAQTSWIYFTWMLEYEALSDDRHSGGRESMHIVHALQSERDLNLQWLGAVPPETVLEIRRKGHAEEIREMLGNGVNALIGINPDNYFRTADQVVANLDVAFKAHQTKLIEARDKKLRLYGIDVPACLVTGGVAIAAAITSSPTLGAISGAMGVAGFSNLKDIKTKYRQIDQEEQERQSSPTGILFRHVRTRA